VTDALEGGLAVVLLLVFASRRFRGGLGLPANHDGFGAAFISRLGPLLQRRGPSGRQVFRWCGNTPNAPPLARHGFNAQHPQPVELVARTAFPFQVLRDARRSF
jgi:hypothetical protein